MPEFIVDEFIKKNLRNDFKFITVISQPVISTYAFQVVDELFGFSYK
jgi:hypothetical protein